MKALEILQKSKTHFSTHAKIDEAIAELKELMKPKGCFGCQHDGLIWVRDCDDCTRRGVIDRYSLEETL